MAAFSLLSTDSVDIKRSQFARRSVLPSSRDSLWQIETGAVRTLTLLEDGTTVTLKSRESLSASLVNGLFSKKSSRSGTMKFEGL